MACETGFTTSPEPGCHITLVLGGGWKLGGAFHSGVALALRDVSGIDPRRVNSLIGTSSGAVVAGLFAAGMSADDLFHRETGAALSADGRALLERVRLRASRHSGAEAGELGSMCVGAEVDDQARPRSAAGAFVRLLPRGTRSMAPLERYFDGLVGADWPTEMDLQLCAVELGSGRRIALTKAHGATVGKAVAASCSIPGLSEPVRIDDREFVDGAIHSINNADLAIAAREHPAPRAGVNPRPDLPTDHRTRHVVIVSAPLSARRVQIDPTPMALLRNTMRAQTRRELRKLEGADQIVLIEPSVRDIIAMGANLNANNRRRRVAMQAYATAVAVLQRAPNAVNGATKN